MSRLHCIAFLALVCTGSLGASWSPPSNVSQPGQGADIPQVGVDSMGNVTAVWAKFIGTNWTIQASTKPFDGTWQASPDGLSSQAICSTLPQIAVSARGDATAAWWSIDSTSETLTLQASTKPYGGIWQATPSILYSISTSSPGIFRSPPQIAAAANGDLIALCWGVNIGRGDTFLIHAFDKPYGAAWADGGSVSVSPDLLHPTDAPQIVFDGLGNAIAVWEQSDGTVMNIYTGTQPYGGTWGIEVLSASGQNATHPQIAADPNGNAVAVWEQSNGSNIIIMARARPYGGSWQAPVALSISTLNSESPQVAMDASGNATAVWSQSDGKNWIVRSSTKTLDGNWQESSDRLSQHGSNSQNPQIAVDPIGNTTVVWENANGDSHVIQSSVRPLGKTWQETPDTISPYDLGASAPQVIVDPQGNATAVWRAFDGTDAVIQAATNTLGPQRPRHFRTTSKVDEKKRTVKTKWNKSSSTNVVQYEIFAWNERILVVSAKKECKAVIHLDSGDFSPEYLHNKYKIRAVDSTGAVGAFTTLGS